MSENLFKVFRSSAGSGKTFALVKEYLKFCLSTENPFYFSRILAITFTNKASGEMKDRLISTLKKAKDQDSVLNEPLLAACQKEINLEMPVFIKRCKSVLSSLLHSYGDLSISTIDKFMLKVIRSFSRDLKLPLNFEVDMQQNRLLERVISQLLSDIGHNDASDKILFDYAKWKIEEGKSWKLEDDLHRSASSLYKEGADKYLDRIKDVDFRTYLELISTYVQENEIFKQNVTGIAQKAVELIESNELEVSEFYRGKYGYAYFFYVLSSGEIKPPNSYHLNALEKETLYGGSIPLDKKDRIITLTPQLIELSNHLLDHFAEGWMDFSARRMLLKHLPAQSLFGKIDQLIDQLKTEENLINISDFNSLISNVVMNDFIPFIYERIGERYNHIMVDEFQDTSIMQFQNLLPLIDESLAKGYQNMIVGDAKQSIYRFRSAEVEQFSQMPQIELEEFQDDLNHARLESLQRNFKEEPLNTNWRSSAEIIRFNNDFFASIMKLDRIAERNKLIFNGHEQLVPQSADPGGYVELRKVQGKLAAEKDLENKVAVKEIIENALALGYNYSDMAILCFSNDQLSELARFLSEENVPLISAEALKLEHSAPVDFLIYLLYWIEDNSNNEARAHIFSFLFDQGKIKGDRVEIELEYISKNGKGLAQLFADRQLPLPTACQSHENLLQWTERQIRAYQLNKSYDPYLQFFEEYVFEFVNRQKGSTKDFLQLWELDKESLSIELSGKGNAVQLMTIHKSKGLEFPIVILPYANYKVNSKPSHIWVENLPKPADEKGLDVGLLSYHSDMENSDYQQKYEAEKIKREGDILNSIYVAFTRAVEQLYILSEEPPISKDSMSLPILLDVFKEEMEENGSKYIRGKATARSKKKEAASDQDFLVLNYYPSSAWNSKVSLSLEMKSQWKEEEEMSPRAYGTLLHEILSKVHTANDRHKVVEEYILNGKLDQDMAKEINAQLDRLFSRKEVSFFFDPSWKINNERSFLSSEAEILRPDRLGENESDLYILDYKSGDRRSADEDQLKKYVSEISKISSKKVMGYLLYLKEEELVKVA